MSGDIQKLFDTVVKNNFCIGCGVCAAVENKKINMVLDENGKYKPSLIMDGIEKGEINVNEICPFSNEAQNEDQIAERQFASVPDIRKKRYLGYYLKNFAGYVKEGDFRQKGSSGGLGSWIPSQLLKHGLVDAIIHVKSSEKEGLLFDFQVSESIEEFKRGAKSKYYPVEMSGVLQYIKEHPKRYAVIGIPCFIKSLRLLSQKDSIINERVKFCIGLVCGHLKSDMFAKSMGWQMGIPPEKLVDIDFREKLPHRGANDYGVKAIGNESDSQTVKVAPTRELYTTNWGHGFFKYNACEFCDDVLAETADVVVGDAWIPKYEADGQGTNVIVIRNPIIFDLILNSKNELHLEELTTDEVTQSQQSGIKHRNEGLSYRLYIKDRANEWRPNKRTQPSNKLSNKRKKVYKLRTKMSETSFVAYNKAIEDNNFESFINMMKPIVKKNDRIVRGSIPLRAIRKIKRVLFLKNRG